MAGSSPLPGFLALVNMASGATIAGTNLALTNAGDDQTFTVPLASIKRYLDPATAVVVQIENDEVQLVTITGGPGGGTFTLTFGGNTTSGILYNASAATVQSALAGLPGDTGDFLVTGVNGGPWTVEFISALADASQVLITASGAGLTGGSSPGVTIARVQAGQGYTTISSSTYTLRYLTAQVLLTTALVGTNVNVRLSSFNYYAYVAIAQANDITFTPTVAMLDSTSLQGASGAGWTSWTPGLASGQFACKTWQLNTGATIFTSHITGKDLLIVSFVAPDGVHALEGFCYLSDTNIQGAVAALAAEDLTFKITGIYNIT